MPNTAMTNQLPATVPEQRIEPIPATNPAFAEQQERTKELRKFNWLAVYLPLILGTLAALIPLGVLAWFALSSEAGSPNRDQASGVADVFITMVCLAPLALIGAGLAGGGVFFLYWRRKRGSLVREKVQGGLRKVDGRLSSADSRARVEQARVVENTVRYRNRFEQLLDQLYYRFAQMSKWINERLAKNRD